jgi:Putative beta-barrel porin-2, OmpL-like. bbp2/Carboxypeptidase regulatory-like domain
MKCNLICVRLLMAGFVLPALAILLAAPTQAQKTSNMAPPGMEESASPFSAGHGPTTFGGKPSSPDTPVVSSSPGEVHRVTRYANGLPMPEAEVVILNGDVNIDRTIVSGSDGTFVFKNLKPGEYQLTAKKEGFALSPTTNVVVAFGKIVTVDVPLGQSLAVSRANNNPAALMSTHNQSAYRMQPASLHLTPAQPSSAQPSIDESAPAVSTSATDAPKPSAGAAEQPLPAAVMDEITAMKKRIEELEAEVRGRAVTEQPPTPAAEPAATTSQPVPVAAVATPTPPVQDPAPIVKQHPDGWAPFSYADWTWMNANGRQHDSPLDSKYFTGEFRADVHYMDDFNHPRDNTMGGSTESFRSNEWQLEQLSLGGDLHVGNVRGRILTMFGLFATTTPRNDASTARGQWDLRNAYRYISEGWGGYHFDNVGHGLNIDAGIFVSYIGLFSYYNFDNWTYQPSYVSSNTPWFFNGLRIQYFPTAKLKIEPWIINGWQSYARTNSKPGLGGQILWRPKPWLSLVFNNYGMGTDSLGNPGRSRIHTDDSVEIREYNNQEGFLDMAAMSFTADAGCEYGGGVSCTGKGGNPKQSFLGWMAYQRFQFKKDTYGITLGGGYLNNPGRYLTLLQPINGADAISGSPYFTANPGDKYHAYDASATFDYMPAQFITFRTELGYRHSDVPYWSGRGGITPPQGNNVFGNVGSPASYVCTNGVTSIASTFAPTGAGFFNSSSVTPLGDNGGPQNSGGAVDLACAAQATTAGLGPGWHAWAPDLRHSQIVATFAIMTRF